MKFIFISVLFLGSTCSLAQAPDSLAQEKTLPAPTEISAVDQMADPTIGEKAKEEAAKAKTAVQGAVANGGDRREASSFSVMGEFSPFDLILPGKVGGSLGYIQSRTSAFDLEYLSRSVSPPSFIADIGGFDDRRVSLLYRSYADRNSFNCHYGISYFDMGVHVAHSYLVSSGAASDINDLMRAKSLGLIFGIGNRWVFPHGLTVGVDWLSWAQPLIVLQQDSSLIDAVQDQSAKAKLQDVFQLAMFFPRFTILKLAAGFTF
jgi:hypothetical protein